METSNWELSKENIQPLKQGREPAKLSKALKVANSNVADNSSGFQSKSDATNNSVRTLILQQEKEEFEQALKTCMDTEDPLSVYYKYTRWLEESFPSGKEKPIRDLVNTCLETLNQPKWLQKYANDWRWFYIWWKFATMSRRVGCLEVYDHMAVNGHCVGLATFYTHWAEAMENAGDFDGAAKVYKSGICKEAQPLQSLIAAYEEFQVRHTKRMVEAQSSGDDDDDGTRMVLGALKPVPGIRGTAPYLRQNVVDETVKCSAAKTEMAQAMGKQQRITVFDESGPASSMSASGFKRETVPRVNAIPIESKACKENIQDPSIWTKANIDRPAHPMHKANGRHESKIHVYVDDEVRIKKPMNVAESSLQGSLKSSTSRTAVPNGETFMCRLDAMKRGKEEYSFEELRASKWKKSADHHGGVECKKAASASHPARRALVSITEPSTAGPPKTTAVTSKNTMASESPPDNTSFTQKLLLEARAAFSNTLRLSAIGGRPSDVDDAPSIAPIIPAMQSGGAGFQIYEDSRIEDVQSGNQFRHDADKENVDPTKNGGLDAAEKRHVAGILCASKEFPIFDEKNKDDVILVEEEEENEFDLDDITVAGLRRQVPLPPGANRLVSTPCPDISRLQPLSLSMFKLDIADPADFDHDSTVDLYRKTVADVVAKNLDAVDTIPKKLSAIAETSREYRSGSTTGSSAGTTRGRVLSGASTISVMPSINEGARGTPYGVEQSSNLEPSSNGPVRKLRLDSEGENEARETVIAQRIPRCNNESINPWQPKIVDYMLSTLPRLDAYPNYHTFDEGIPKIKEGDFVNLGGEAYMIVRLIGEGAYAKVFKCLLEQGSSTDLVLKVQKPGCPLEFAICVELHRRLKAQNSLDTVAPGLTSFVDGYIFRDGSVLVSEYSPYGTLIDLVNIYKQISDDSLPEIVVAYLTADILRTVEAVHGANIIHGDVKPDNFLVLNAPPMELADIPRVSTVRLIDWGRSINMAAFPPTLTFSGQSKTSGFMCCEMRDGRPWTYQTDYYGILGTVHVLAFGTYMTTHKVSTTGRWRVNSTFKRRWDASLWREFFDTFLNVRDCFSLPSLSEWRQRFDDFVKSQRDTRPSGWTSEVHKMRESLVQLTSVKVKNKKATLA